MALFRKRISYFFCTVSLIAGLAIGWYGGEYICKNDTFSLVGEKEYSIALGTADFVYEDEGVRIIEFGRDISGEASVETDMTALGDGRYTLDATVPGRYYVKYTVDSYRYGEIERIRIFTVGGEN